MNTVREKWITRLDISMLCAWLVLGAVLAVVSYVDYGMDFRDYFAAARVLLDGGNPYEYEQVAGVLFEISGTSLGNPFFYPPWFAWIFLPYAAMPFQFARAAWMAVNFVLWNVTLLRLNTALGQAVKGWRLYLLFALATFSFGWVTWRFEQAGILLFAVLTETILAVQAGRTVRAGIWLAILLIKPNITLLIAACLSLWLIRNGRWRIVLGAFVVLAALLVVSTVITPDWFKPILKGGFGAGLTAILDGQDQVLAYRINSTFPDWLGTFGLVKQIRYPLYIVFALAILIWVAVTVWRSDSLLIVVSVSVLASFAVTPYALQYDYPPLVIPFFWNLFAFKSTGRGRWVALLLAGFVLSVIIWQQNISWAYWMVAGLLALYFWAEMFGQGGGVSALEG